MAGRRRRLAEVAGPPKLTEQLASRICELVRLGLTPEEAAAGAGLEEFVVQHWLEMGQAVKKGPYRKFLKAVRLAQAARVAELAKKADQLGEHSAQTIRRLEERIEDLRRREADPPPIVGRASKLTPRS